MANVPESLCDSPSLLDQRHSFSLVSTSRGATRLQKITASLALHMGQAIQRLGDPLLRGKTYLAAGFAPSNGKMANLQLNYRRRRLFPQLHLK